MCIRDSYTAQDWEGFRQLVSASNLQDKELILRVLQMYPDTETREREIKNISYVFEDLAKTILPQLRRSRLIAKMCIRDRVRPYRHRVLRCPRYRLAYRPRL